MSFSPPKLDQFQSQVSSQQNYGSYQQQDAMMQDANMNMSDQLPMGVLYPNNQIANQNQLALHQQTIGSNSYNGVSQSLRHNINQKKQFNKKIMFNQIDQDSIMNDYDSENIDPNMLLMMGDMKGGLIKQKQVRKQLHQPDLKIADKLGQLLPYELQLIVTWYLTPKDNAIIMKSLSKYWHDLIKKNKYWELYDKKKQLTINERLQIVQCLVERRSKGKLYKAIDRVTNETCLLRKIFLDVTNAGQDDGIPTSVLREISHLKTLNHQNIGKINHAEVKNELAQLVYEFHDQNLKEYVRKNSQNLMTLQSINGRPRTEKVMHFLSNEKTKGIIYQVLQAICFSHRNGIMHRNLKPDNIMITKDEVVKLVDFSLSRIAAIPHFPYTPEDPKERERSGREARRLWYRAPELLFRKQMYSFEVDIWSIGCLFAELQLGEALFNGESEIEQLFKIFRFTGSPSQEVIDIMRHGTENEIVNLPFWERVHFGNVCYPKDSQEMKNIVAAYIPSRESSLMKLFDLKDKMGYEGLDLLFRLLDINPQTRISAEQAIQHPFFDSIRQLENNLKYDYSIIPLIENYHGDISPSHYKYIASNMHENEIKLMPNGNLMSIQKQITDNMRSILVDWLVDVSVHFEVMNETLHFAINYIDRTLSKLAVEKKQLQLVGVSCMKIADVFNERSKEYYRQENSTEYAYITADEYTAQEVIKMEKEILNLLNFELYSPTSVSFLKLYYQILQSLDQSTKILSQYLADLILLAVNQHQYEPSMLASAYLLIAMQAQEIPMATINQDQMNRFRDIYVQWYNYPQFKKCVDFVLTSWLESRHNPNFSRFDAVNNKYEQFIETINIRQLHPPIIQARVIEEWFNYPQYEETHQNNFLTNLNLESNNFSPGSQNDYLQQIEGNQFPDQQEELQSQQMELC